VRFCERVGKGSAEGGGGKYHNLGLQNGRFPYDVHYAPEIHSSTFVYLNAIFQPC